MHTHCVCDPNNHTLTLKKAQNLTRGRVPSMQALGAKSSSRVYGPKHATQSTQTHKQRIHTHPYIQTQTQEYLIKTLKCQRSIPFLFLQFDVHKSRDWCFAMMLESDF